MRCELFARLFVFAVAEGRKGAARRTEVQKWIGERRHYESAKMDLASKEGHMFTFRGRTVEAHAFGGGEL